MSAGGDFNTMYADFGNNQQDAIILTVDISSGDDSAKIVNKYKSNGTTPKFPIVLTTGNSKQVANLFDSPNSGGPTWIMHPDREYTKTNYGLSTMKANLQAAIDDDCDDGSEKFTLTVKNGSGGGSYAENAKIDVTANTPEDGYVFEAWTGDVQYVSSSSSASTTVTMPAKAITIEATYRDTTNDNIDTTNAVSIMYLAGWEGGKDDYGSTIDVDTSKLESDTIVSASMSLTTSDQAKNEWAWVKLSAYLANNMKPVTAFKIVYQATDTVNLVLDQENLSDAGTSYLYKLPPTGRAYETVLLSSSKFKQPEWHDKNDALELEKVKSVSFAATKEGSDVSLDIKDVVLYNYDPTSILQSHITNTSAIELIRTNNMLQLQIPRRDQYKVSIFGVNGRQLFSKTLELQQGLNTVPMTTQFSNSVKILKVEGTKESALFKTGN